MKKSILTPMLKTILLLTVLFKVPALGLDTVGAVQKGGFRTEYELRNRENFGHRLTVSYYSGQLLVRQSKTYIAHPIYRFCVGDINVDGVVDVCVGVEKTTKFDPVYRKRLFVYTHREGILCPLWMGSKVGTNLQDFTTLSTNAKVVIRTIEKFSNGRFAVGEYTWKSFGLVWQRYIHRGIEYEKACSQLIF